MSYCRFGSESDLYVYHDGDDFVCCACRLEEPVDYTSVTVTVDISYLQLPDGRYKTVGDILRHLYKHRELGDRVPKSAIQRLNKELKHEYLQKNTE